jgi:outer membrane protein assembly factor BamB
VDWNGQLNWTYITASPIETTPVIGAEGTIYLGDDSGTLTALYSDGNLLWTTGNFGSIQSSPALGPNGTIVFGSTDGVLHALSPSGQPKWNTPVGSQLQSSTALSNDGTTVYVTSFGAPAPTPDDTVITSGGALSAVDLSTGAIIWSQTFVAASAASPAVDLEGNVYAVSGTSVFGYNPAGESTWTGSLDSIVLSGDLAITNNEALLISQNAAPGQPPFLARIQIGSEAPADTAGAGAFILGSPVVDSEGTTYFSTADKNIYAYSYADGVGFNNIWGVVFPDQVTSAMAIGPNGTLYFGCKDGHIYAVSP